MRKIKVVGTFLVLHSGRVRLDEKQAKAREHGIRKVEGDTYEITGPVGFKFGEIFSYDGHIGKIHAEDVEEIRGPGRPAGQGSKADPKKGSKKDSTGGEDPT